MSPVARRVQCLEFLGGDPEYYGPAGQKIRSKLGVLRYLKPEAAAAGLLSDWIKECATAVLTNNIHDDIVWES